MSNSDEIEEKKAPQKTLLDYTPEQWAVLVKEIGNQFREFETLKGAQTISPN